jgi:hypothetical protein
LKLILLAFALIFVTVPISQGVNHVAAQDSAGLIDAAKVVVAKLAAEDFCVITESFESKLKQSLTADKIQDVWANLVARVGEFKRQTSASAEKTPEGYHAIYVRCEFEKSVATVQVTFDAGKKIIGLWMAPGERPPAAQASSGQAMPEGTSVDDVKRRAKEVLDLLVAEKFSQVGEMFNTQMKNGFSLEQLKQIWANINQNVGSFKQVTDAQYAKIDGYDVVAMRCAFERGYVQVRVAYDGEKKIGGLYFLPAQ